MIVIDESIHDPLLIDAIAAWYRGQVLSVRRLRTGTLVKDDAIPMLLLQAMQPTFVTINVDDFWRKAPASSRYCILAILRLGRICDFLNRSKSQILPEQSISNGNNIER